MFEVGIEFFQIAVLIGNHLAQEGIVPLQPAHDMAQSIRVRSVVVCPEFELERFAHDQQEIGEFLHLQERQAVTLSLIHISEPTRPY